MCGWYTVCRSSNIIKKAYRKHIESTSKAHRKHIESISKAYRKHIESISKACPKHVQRMSKAYRKFHIECNLHSRDIFLCLLCLIICTHSIPPAHRNYLHKNKVNLDSTVKIKIFIYLGGVWSCAANNRLYIC